MLVLLVWIDFGVLSGLVICRTLQHTARRLALDVTLGITGAIAGGMFLDTSDIPQPAILMASNWLGAAVGCAALPMAYCLRSVKPALPPDYGLDETPAAGASFRHRRSRLS